VLPAEASACNTDTTQTQPHQIANTQRTENKTTDVVIQQHIGLVASCWFLSLRPTFMMHGHKNLKLLVLINVMLKWVFRKICLKIMN